MHLVWKLLREAIKTNTQLMAGTHLILFTDQGQWYSSDPKASKLLVQPNPFSASAATQAVTRSHTRSIRPFSYVTQNTRRKAQDYFGPRTVCTLRYARP